MEKTHHYKSDEQQNIFSLQCRKYNPSGEYDEIQVITKYRQTALILIDLWNNINDNLFIKRVISLIKFCRKNEILIIHCPYFKFNHIHPEIEIQNNDVVIFGLDSFADIVISRNINTLVYAGYDTLRCVIDKPCGILNILFSHPNVFKSVLIRDCAFSREKRTHKAGINILEKHGVLTANVKAIVGKSDQSNFNKKNIFKNITEEKPRLFKRKIYSKETGIVISGKLPKNKIDKIINFVNEYNLPVFYQKSARFNKAKEYNLLFKYFFDIKTENQFIFQLRLNLIERLLYCGCSLDMEMITGQAGLLRLYMQKRYKQNKIPDYHIIKDYSYIDFPTYSIDENTMKEVICHSYRDIDSNDFNYFKKVIIKDKEPKIFKEYRRAKAALERIIKPFNTRLN